jgi:RNA polymerase sigma-70 factor (ECF subfamily)
MWNPRIGAQFTTWFYKVVIHLCFDHNKKKRPLDVTDDRTIVDSHPGQETVLETHEKQALLDRFINELPKRQRLALTLCFYEEMSHKEAADVLGVTLKAIQSLLMRAKSTLRQKIAQQLDGEAL